MKRHDMAVRSYYGPVNARARAVVLLSGGVDSATAAALTVREGFDLYALTFSYGQRHQAEVEAARRVAVALGVVRHEVLTFDLRAFGGSALTADLAVPKDRALEEMGRDIPITYVPARNTIFLSFALAWAEVLEAGDIVIGVNRLDYSGYPDCRPEYIEAFERMAALGVDYSLTLSCYDPAPDGAACGRCDACALRRKGFVDAGVPDPTLYCG
jgi:7-cyano-7-deazaguanine synthase